MARAANISLQSPFMPADGQTLVTPITENAPIELRGIMAQGGNYLYGFFDPTKQKAIWVKANQPGYDFVVTGHDIAKQAVTVEYQGRTLNLALKPAAKS